MSDTTSSFHPPDKKFLIPLLFLITLLFFRFLLSLHTVATGIRILLALGFLLLIHVFLLKAYRLKAEMGLILLRSTAGLALLDRLARSEKTWKFIADIGFVLGYGVSSFFIVKEWKSRVSGIVLLVVSLFLFLILSPVALPAIENLPVSERSSSQGHDTTLAFVSFLALTLLAGFGGMTTILMIRQALVILFTTLARFFGNVSIPQAPAGAAFVLPGVNIDFIAGILALICILVIHEGFHGIFARIARIDVKSAGLVLFGSIPIGAFVEPDEAAVKRAEKMDQLRIFVAGSTGNFLLFLVFGVLFGMLLFVSISLYDPRVFLTYNGTTTAISAIDEYAVSWDNLLFVLMTVKSENRSTITFLTENGPFTLTKQQSGTFGVSFIRKYREPFTFLDFIFTFLSLGFLLNFFIGSMNLVPIPLFDGYRIMEVIVQNERLTYLLAAALLLFFALNFLPWFVH